MHRIHTSRSPRALVGGALAIVLAATGCASKHAAVSELTMRDAIAQYATAGAERLGSAPETAASASVSVAYHGWDDLVPKVDLFAGTYPAGRAQPYFTLGMLPQDTQPAPETQPARSTVAGVPEGYWRKDIWHQMGHEAKEHVRGEYGVR